MKVSAHSNSIRVSAQKCRLVADLIRGKAVSYAMNILEFSPQKSAGLLKKTLESAIANAEHNESADIDTLIIKEIYIGEGRTLKRSTARAKGRGNQIGKQTCHINIIVG